VAVIRIVVADDHPLVRTGLRRVLARIPDMRVVAEADSPDALFRALQVTECDLALVDLHMPVGRHPDGMPMLRQLHLQLPALPVLVFTLLDHLSLMEMLVGTGVAGVLLKTAPLRELPRAISQIYAGGSYYSASLRAAWHGREKRAGEVPDRPLTDCEREVFELFVRGLRVSEVAQALGRSVKTVSRQKLAAMAKLRLESNAEAYAYARARGLA
jgi:two-component system, NarL family, captular synthesis response regulator RcsB